MSTTTPTGTITLHPRACDCTTCQPHLRRESTCSMPSQQIIISQEAWEALGRPGCIESYNEKVQKR